MEIVVRFCVDADIIYCPVDILNSLTEYRKRFIDWLYDRQNHHSNTMKYKVYSKLIEYLIWDLEV
jgi:hypothetical protein